MSDGELSILPVSTDNIETVWGLISHDLNLSLEHDVEEWTPDSIAQVLSAGKAFLHVIFEGDGYLGFTITCLDQKPKGLDAFIWIAGGKGVTKAFDLYENEMRKNGIATVTWGSARKGFERMNHGYDKVAIIYRKELNDAQS